MNQSQSLVIKLITLIKQHRKPSSPKSIAVLMKVMEAQLLAPKHTLAQFKGELKAALKSDTVWSESMRQQHSEEEIRGCFRNLLAAIDAPPAPVATATSEPETEDEEN